MPRQGAVPGLTMALALALSACGGSSGGPTPAAAPVTAVTPPPAATTPVASLRTLAAFPIGAAVSYGNETYSYSNSVPQQNVLKQHFSQITAGNIMKMSYLHPSLNTYSYTDADSLVKFATDNGITVHGHTLVWHSDYQVPGFMKTFTGDKAAWLAMLKTHEQTIATHYAGKLASWDVVNEALADGGGYRDSLFHQKMGADYIEQAFINTRAVDPGAELYYNDYNLESDPAKLATLNSMLDGYAQRGVPISGVGFQMHIMLDTPSVATIQAALKTIVDRKLKVKISELDIPINNPYSAAYKAGDIKTVLTTELALAQKKRYCDVIKAYMDTVPASLRGGIVVWGVNDPGSWLNTPGHTEWPLLFDAAYAAKPALRGFADGLSGIACTAL